MKKKKYWYICEIWECPVCGHAKEYRYRVYTKPDNYWKVVTDYDYCDV